MSLAGDQAVELRRLVQGSNASLAGERSAVAAATSGRDDRQAVGEARLLAITSGKGGVGKSNIAVNLAVQLSAMGRRTALLDADLGLANADVLCGLSPVATLAHVVAGRRTLEDLQLKAPGGFTLIPGASGLTQMAGLAEHERARLLALLRRLTSDHDLLIVDTGAGIGPNVMSFLMAADELLVVTTPEPTAITDAYAVIKAVARRRSELPVGLLVNMARDRREGRAVYERVAQVCRRFIGFVPRDAGHIVMDAKVGQAVRRRRPFVIDAPNSAAGLCLKVLAHKIDKQATEPQRSFGFLRQLAAGWSKR